MAKPETEIFYMLKTCHTLEGTGSIEDIKDNSRNETSFNKTKYFRLKSIFERAELLTIFI